MRERHAARPRSHRAGCSRRGGGVSLRRGLCGAQKLDANLMPAPASTSSSGSGWAVFFEILVGAASLGQPATATVTLDMAVSPLDARAVMIAERQGHRRGAGAADPSATHTFCRTMHCANGQSALAWPFGLICRNRHFVTVHANERPPQPRRHVHVSTPCLCLTYWIDYRKRDDTRSCEPRPERPWGLPTKRSRKQRAAWPPRSAW